MDKLNHSRHMDFYAKDMADKAYFDARRQPTHKQKEFYKSLYAKCKDNGVDTTTNHANTRVGVATAIDTLIMRLQEAGVDVRGNDKAGGIVTTIGQDRRGRYYAREGLMVDGGKSHISDKRTSMHKLF